MRNFRSGKVAAAGFFFLLSLLYFGPALFPSEGWALGGHDMRGLFYPWLEQVRLSITTGQIPWWDPARFAGYPFLSNPQIAFFYPPTWLAILLPTRIGISLYYLFHFWMAGWGMFILASSFLTKDERSALPGSLPFGPLAAGVTFMFAGFFTARLMAGHMGLIAVHCWVPWLIWSTERHNREPRWERACLTGLFLALAILAGHTTSLLYVGLIWGVFALFWLAQDVARWGIWLRQMSTAAMTALLLAAVQLLPLAEISRLAARTSGATFEFATDFSFPLSHLITLVVPQFFGEPTRAGYWSVPNFEELTAYFGVVALLGIALALRRPTGRTWLWLGLAILGLLLAFGRYGFLYRFVYDWLPPFRLARAPGRAMFLVVFGGSLLLSNGLEQARQRSWPWRPLLWGTALIGIGAISATGALFVAQHPSETSGRLWHQLGGWSWATVMLLVAAAVIWRWQIAPLTQKLRWQWALVILIIVDLWTLGYKFRRVEPMTPDQTWFEARQVLGENFSGRILPWGISIFDQNGAGQVGLDSLFGYNALEIGSYTALVSSVPDPRSTAFDVLGATHVVAVTPLDSFTEGERPLRLVGQAGRTWVYERPRPLPVVRLVSRTERLPAAEDGLARLHQPDFNPAETAVVDRPLSCAAGDGSGTAAVVAARPGYWEIETTAAAETLLVVAEIAYPGWRVEIDGVRVNDWPVVYGTLRGVCVSAGEHTVVWRYVPQSFRWGALASLAGLALLLASVWGLFTSPHRQRGSSQREHRAADS